MVVEGFGEVAVVVGTDAAGIVKDDGLVRVGRLGDFDVVTNGRGEQGGFVVNEFLASQVGEDEAEVHEVALVIFEADAKMADDDGGDAGFFVVLFMTGDLVVELVDEFGEDLEAGEGEEVGKVGDNAVVGSEKGVFGNGIDVGWTVKEDVVVVLIMGFEGLLQDLEIAGVFALLDAVFDFDEFDGGGEEVEIFDEGDLAARHAEEGALFEVEEFGALEVVLKDLVGGVFAVFDVVAPGVGLHEPEAGVALGVEVDDEDFFAFVVGEGGAEVHGGGGFPDTSFEVDEGDCFGGHRKEISRQATGKWRGWQGLDCSWAASFLFLTWVESERMNTAFS